MDMGNQHPSITKLQEMQKKVKDLGQQVATFSGLLADAEYKKLEGALTRQLFEIDSVDAEGKGAIQQTRNRAAQETERLLKDLEQNATHPCRLEIQKIFEEAQKLVTDEIAPLYGGGSCITEEFEEGIASIILRLTQVKTEGKTSLRKARYRTLNKVLAIQEILESCMKRHILPLPLSTDTHPSVSKINSVMCEMNKARASLIALLIGVNKDETYRHLSCILTGLIADLDSLDVSGHIEVRNYRKEVVGEINSLLKYLDLEEEGATTAAYDLTQNQSIMKIEAIRKTATGMKNDLLKADTISDLQLGFKADLQGLIAQLDEVSPGRNPFIREARRRTVVEVQAAITYIDLKEALGKRQNYGDQTNTEHPSHKEVWNVLGSLSELQREVLSFDGNRTDKNYSRLEELIIKQLLALDAVDVEGEERSKVARKQAVKFANNILSYLDMKTDEWEY